MDKDAITTLIDKHEHIETAARALKAALEQTLAQKARDQALLGNARVDLQRYTTLSAQDAATPQQLATQKALVAQLA